MDETEKGYSLEEAQGIVKRQLDEAIDWRRENLDPLLEAATERYLGKKFGDEKDGRSQIVMTTVRDVTRSLLTALTRIFFGPDRVVEYEPVGPEDEALAEQRTEYIRHVIENDNDGVRVLWAAWKDAIVRKLGVVMYRWDDMTRVEGSEHTGLSAMSVDALLDGEGVEATVYDREDGLFDVDLKRTIRSGRARIEAVPPEEFVFSPNARGRDDARIIGRVRELPASDLIAMGVPADMVERAKGETERSQDDLMEQARRFDGNTFGLQEDEGPEETRPVRFADLYVKIDLDGDDIAELRHVQAVGPNAEWVDEDPPIVDHAPFALFEMDPEPHTLIGLSADDDVGDLQRIESYIVRGMLDSLALSLNPATEVVEGRVNIKDLLNPEVGRVVRVKQPGMMREVDTPFVGGAALPVLQYMAEIKENRTGQSKAAAGLDADALQSSTRAAVAATVSAAAQRQEMIARLMAEGGMRQLFKGLLRLITQHQDFERVVRLRGEFVTVDPRHWQADADVRVNVALGTGLMEDRRQTLMASAEKQEQHIAQGSPLGSFSKLRDTYRRLMEMSGFKNVDAFWPPFTEEQEAQMRQAQAQNQPPSEAEILERIEMAKLAAQQEKQRGELMLKAAELRLKQAEMLRTTSIKEAEVEAKAGQGTVDAALEIARLHLDELTTMAGIRVGETAQ